MRKIRYIFLFLLISILFLSGLHAQNKKEQLQDEKAQLEKEIQLTNELLSETRENKSSSLNQLVLLKNKINTREALIDNIQLQINTLNQQIDLNQEIIHQLTLDLENLKEEYAIIIYNSYKNHDSFSRLMFIFSAEDFSQAYRRIKYFQQYSAYRKTQAALIEETQLEINTRLEELEQQKDEKVGLLNSMKSEKSQLLSEKDEKNKMVVSLNKKEKELMASIQEKEAAAQKLQEEIEKIIAEEIAKANKKEGTNNTSTFALTPEELKLSNDFETNQGKLPWPVERGIISSTFGEHPHEVLKGVKTKNNGINILTSENTPARTVFAGKVTKVLSIPHYHYVVMIRHGEYVSVYSNLLTVTVEEGDEVRLKQSIGQIFTNAENKTEIHFELWKGKELLDPSNWLAKGK